MTADFEELEHNERPRRPDRVPEDVTDLNHLFHRQQVERSRAETARTHEARKAHEELAKRYEDQIEELTSAEFHFPPDACSSCTSRL